MHLIRGNASSFSSSMHLFMYFGRPADCSTLPHMVEGEKNEEVDNEVDRRCNESQTPNWLTCIPFAFFFLRNAVRNVFRNVQTEYFPNGRKRRLPPVWASASL